MKKIVSLFMCVVILLCVCACKGNLNNSRFVKDSVVITAENLPKIAVTATNERLAVNLTVTMLGCEAAAAYNYFIVCETPDECYELLANGECDLVIAHEPSQSQWLTLEEKGIEYASAVIAKDALVFTVNGQHGANDLSIEQIASIYSSKVLNWSDLGLHNGEIATFKPETSSAAANAFEKYIRVDFSDINTPKKHITTNEGNFFAEIPYDNGINSITFALYSDLQRPSTDRYGARKYLSVAGVSPDASAIQSGTYPLCVDILLTFSEGLADDSVSKLYRDWILSEQGTASGPCLLCSTHFLPWI